MNPPRVSPPVRILLGPLSELQRRFVVDIVGELPARLALVGTASTAADSLHAAIERLRPEVVIMASDASEWAEVCRHFPEVRVIGIEATGKRALLCRGDVPTDDLAGLILRVARGSTEEQGSRPWV